MLLLDYPVISMSLRVLFIQPPAVLEGGLLKHIKYPPLGLASIAGYVRSKGYIVDLYDAYSLSGTVKTIIDRTRSFKADVVAISSTTALIDNTFKTAEAIKKHDKRIKVVVGGPHATADPAHCLSNQNVDAALIGEGDMSLHKTLQAFQNNESLDNIMGVAFRDKEEKIITSNPFLIKNIDELPFPAYDLLPLDEYKSPYSTRKPFTSMCRTRGCSYVCTYCEIPQIYKRTFRIQSPERTIKEVDYLVNEFGIKEIAFKDPIFTLDRNNVMKFCDLLIKRNYTLIWSANSRVDNITQEMCLKMKEAGCESLTFGLESGDQQILNNLKKHATIQQARQAISYAKKAKIKVVANFMVGNPGETNESINKTIKFMKEIGPDYVNIAFTTALPGTELWNQAEENNWIRYKDYASVNYEDLQMNATNISDEELRKLLNKMYRKFYFRPRYILKRAKKLSLPEIRNSWNGFFSILHNTLRVKVNKRLP